LELGGGYPDHEVSDISFFWMVDQVSPFLFFDREYLNSLHDCDDIHASTHYAGGKIYESYHGMAKLFGHTTRTPGGYYTKERAEGLEATGFAGATNEEIHPSVRLRIMHTNGEWWPKALDGWKAVYKQITIKDQTEMHWVWNNPVSGRELRESKLGPEEKGLAGPTLIELMDSTTEIPSQKHHVPSPSCVPSCISSAAPAQKRRASVMESLYGD